MEDILLMLLLKKKGIITERDIHELHELTSASLEEPVYLSEVKESTSIAESEARSIVSKMYHIDGGRKYVGEKFDMYKAKEICERYRSILPINVTVCDVYIAINSQYHDYYILFKSWFSDNIETKIIESAISYWFKDSDYKGNNKVLHYFKGA